MGDRPVQSKKRYLLAFVIGTLIFIGGFILTYSISNLEFKRIIDFQDETSYKIFKDKLEYRLFEADICKNDFLIEITDDLGFQGSIIAGLEKKLGKGNKRVLFRKKYYSLVELEHFEFVNIMNKECGSNISTILFFYSNDDEEIDESEDAGKILDVVHRRNPNLVIYSFDINLDSELVRGFLNKYGVVSSPTIIINENKKLTKLGGIWEIEKYLGNIDERVIRL